MSCLHMTVYTNETTCCNIYWLKTSGLAKKIFRVLLSGFHICCLILKGRGSTNLFYELITTNFFHETILMAINGK